MGARKESLKVTDTESEGDTIHREQDRGGARIPVGLCTLTPWGAPREPSWASGGGTHREAARRMVVLSLAWLVKRGCGETLHLGGVSLLRAVPGRVEEEGPRPSRGQESLVFA